MLDLELDPDPEARGPLPIIFSRMAPLIHAFQQVYADLGFDEVADRDELFRQQVLAQLIEPSSKLDSLRVIEETGLSPFSYATVKRWLPVNEEPTLYFETDGSREPGFSKDGASTCRSPSDCSPTQPGRARA